MGLHSEEWLEMRFGIGAELRRLAKNTLRIIPRQGEIRATLCSMSGVYRKRRL
jgi:hypothetical protein